MNLSSVLNNKQTQKQLLVMAAVTAVAVAFSTDVLAGAQNNGTTGATAFDTVWEWLSDAMSGSLGRVAAGAMILVGVVAGIARQSIMGFAVGVGAGIGLYSSPMVIDAMMTATLAHAADATQAITSITNGMGM